MELKRQTGTRLEQNGAKELPKVSIWMIVQKEEFVFLTLAFGFYFIGEHGIMNWMKKYTMDALGFSTDKAALISSLLFVGIMLGRLVLAPMVQRIGMQKSLLYAYSLGTVFFALAFLIGENGLYLLFLSGMCLSVVYPTMTMSITLYFKPAIAATATGVILAAATIFDILFNLVFGILIEKTGYTMGMLVLVLAMVLGAAVYLLFYQRTQKRSI